MLDPPLDAEGWLPFARLATEREREKKTEFILEGAGHHCTVRIMAGLG